MTSTSEACSLTSCRSSASACSKFCANPSKMGTISRAQGSLTFPANFILVGASNPCLCGFFGDPVKECTCSHQTTARYQEGHSDPLLDRIDIHIGVHLIE